MSYAALKLLIQDLDLAPHGVAPKSVVATVMSAGDYAATLLVALLARYAAAPLSAALKAEEVVEAIKLFKVQALVASPDDVRRLRDHLPKEICLMEVLRDQTR